MLVGWSNEEREMGWKLENLGWKASNVPGVDEVTIIMWILEN
jgi:hypothetical protein